MAPVAAVATTKPSRTVKEWLGFPGGTGALAETEPLRDELVSIYWEVRFYEERSLDCRASRAG